MELASEWTAFAGKLLAELGAEVILVEPPEGSSVRGYEPFAGDEPGPERSLWWWHYQTSKRGVTLDLADPAGRDRLRRLVGSGGRRARGRRCRVGWRRSASTTAALRGERPELIWVSISPFGTDNPRSGEPATDLTILAGGGPVWSCGYDDHTLAAGARRRQPGASHRGSARRRRHPRRRHPPHRRRIAASTSMCPCTPPPT